MALLHCDARVHACMHMQGCAGVGIVNAMEVVHAFPGEEGLKKFRTWVEAPDAGLAAAAARAAGRGEGGLAGTDSGADSGADIGVPNAQARCGGGVTLSGRQEWLCRGGGLQPFHRPAPASCLCRRAAGGARPMRLPFRTVPAAPAMPVCACVHACMQMTRTTRRCSASSSARTATCATRGPSPQPSLSPPCSRCGAGGHARQAGRQARRLRIRMYMYMRGGPWPMGGWTPHAQQQPRPGQACWEQRMPACLAYAATAPHHTAQHSCTCMHEGMCRAHGDVRCM